MGEKEGRRGDMDWEHSRETPAVCPDDSRGDTHTAHGSPFFSYWLY